jgi:molybdate transport system ATP-binding protein
MAPALTAEFEKTYPGGPRIRCAFTLPDDGSRVTVLFGPSGSGKTTILRCLAGLERPETGSVAFGGTAWFDSGRGTFLPPQRRRVGLLFQDYALFPQRTALGNVAYGLRSLESRERRARGLEMLALLGVADLAGRYPGQLSGGEKQRVALARALSPRPRLLLLDEPLSALDAPTRGQLRGELRRLLAGLDVPTLLVTHDRVEALSLGDRIVVVDRGSTVQVGSVESVFSRPADAAVAQIVGVENVVQGRVVASLADGLVSVHVGSASLTALDPGGLDAEVLVCIRAEEILLQRGAPGRVSARNRLEGHVVAIIREGALLRVDLDCGFPFSAVVTPSAAEELELEADVKVTAFIKSPAIHLIPRNPVLRSEVPQG